MANIQFSKTWWGQQWLNSLSNIDYSNRILSCKQNSLVNFSAHNFSRKVAKTQGRITENL